MGRILIVEDDSIISKGLVQIVKSINNQLKIIVTGYAEEALAYAKNNYIDAFFLDIQLEDYSGIELAREIREIDAYKFTPIVFITAVPTKELLAFKEIHCYDYIVKPFKQKEVQKIFETIINYGIKEENSKPILKLKQKNHAYIIQQDEIIYMESKLKKISIITIHEEISLSSYTLKEILSLLTEDFIQCHKGFIINQSYIKKVDSNNNLIYMRKIDTPIPLGRKYKACLRGE